MRRLIRPLVSMLDTEQRLRNLPQPTYPDDLPVVARRADIARAISANQVVIICGETGSGKTTQLPKICLELQRGVTGLIGHTHCAGAEKPAGASGGLQGALPAVSICQSN